MVNLGPIKSTNFEHDEELDVRGWDCPVPILRAIRVINRLSPGQILHVVATDPGSMVDFPAFANQSGNTLLEAIETNGEFHYLIKKG